MYIGLHVNYPLLLPEFNETGIFATNFRKNTQMKNFVKIRPVKVELFHADRQADRRIDMTKLIVAFRNFSNAPKNIRLQNSFICYYVFSLSYLILSLPNKMMEACIASP